MSKLSLRIMELLGLSLGVGRSYFRDFFEGNCSVLRLNYYPPCQKPDLTLGTGPHCDPTSLTILHQDDVGGLQVYVDNQWQYIYTNFDALVVNIGDTFMVTKKKKKKRPLHAETEKAQIYWFQISLMMLLIKLTILCVIVADTGSFKWDIQELLTQSSGKQHDDKKIPGFLLESQER